MRCGFAALLALLLTIPGGLSAHPAGPIVQVLPPPDFQELNAKTYRTDSAEFTIQNLGDSALEFQVLVTDDQDGRSHLSVNGDSIYTGSIPVGGPPAYITVTYDGIGLPDPSEWNWRLEVTSNDPLNDPGAGGEAIDIILNVFVADEWYTCTQDTVSTGVHRLAVSSCLRLGDRGAGGGLYEYATGREWLYTASPVLAWRDGLTKRVYRDLYWTSIDECSRAANQAFRAQSEITITRDSTLVSGDSTYGADVARGVASSTDSLFDLAWEVLAFKTPSTAHGAVMRYTITNRTAQTFDSLILGLAADFDVDSSITANDGIAGMDKAWVGAQGGFYDETSIYIPQPHYGALFCVGQQGIFCNAFGGQVLDNVDYVYPGDAFNADSLYDVMARTTHFDGAILSADTVTDVSLVLVDQVFVDLAPDDTLRLIVGMAQSDISVAAMEATIRALRLATDPETYPHCVIEVPGDVNINGSVTSSDIIKIVGYIFKGAAPPLPCTANGDVNCDGAVTAADVIYEVNFVFKGGAPPCDICNQSPMPCVLNP